MDTVTRSTRHAASPAWLEMSLLVLAVGLGTASLAVAVMAGWVWFVLVLAATAVPVLVAWRRGPSEPGRHRR